ncbi:hypothetical protein [Ferruginibacter sp.]
MITPATLFSFFPVLFIGGWVLITFVIARFGWSSLAGRYKAAPGSFTGTRLSYISAKINFTNYNNCLNLQYNNEGILLQPIIIFRLFHPPLFIPWNEIMDVKDKTIFFSKWKKMFIGSATVCTITLSRSVFERFEKEYLLHSFSK